MEKIDTPPMKGVQGLEDIACGTGGFGSTRVKLGNDTGEKKGTIGQNERTGEKENEEVKNETMKGSDRNSDRTRTKNKKTNTKRSSRLSWERQVISVK